MPQYCARARSWLVYVAWSFVTLVPPQFTLYDCAKSLDPHVPFHSEAAPRRRRRDDGSGSESTMGSDSPLTSTPLSVNALTLAPSAMVPPLASYGFDFP